MIAYNPLVVSLENPDRCRDNAVGGKGANLSRLIGEGFKVPPGFCLTASAYREFIKKTGIDAEIKVELGRKDLSRMRWEEIWDAALRIRSLFLRYDIPGKIVDAVEVHYRSLTPTSSLVVRSSAPGEDSSGLSFAGLHESIVDIAGFEKLLEAIRMVWASLWSDAALLYRREMKLDPDKSSMAVVVQEFVPGGPSGVAFSRDPRSRERSHSIIEAVPGTNSELVDGLVDPDRWIVDRGKRQILDRRAGNRPGNDGEKKLPSDDEILQLYDKIISVEKIMGWPADVEWTGTGEKLYILQARPITSGNKNDSSDKRQWYLSLRPKLDRLRKLGNRVDKELLPQLQKEAELLGRTEIDALDDEALGQVIKERSEALKKWRKIYYDEFIPLAHGVRHLGMYYNNEVKPENPYEFMALLENQDLLASKRNRLLNDLARQVRNDSRLRNFIKESISESASDYSNKWPEIKTGMMKIPGSDEFINNFEILRDRYAQVSFKGTNLSDNPDIYLHTVLQLSEAPEERTSGRHGVNNESRGPEETEKKLLDAVGSKRRDEAREIIELGRLSWRLRDDDNILVGHLESLLQEALDTAGRRLTAKGRLDRKQKLRETAAMVIADALIFPSENKIELPEEKEEETDLVQSRTGKPRQLVGQPAGPGAASGPARIVRDGNDLKRFKFGEILVCDAIQPIMTHIVPLAGGIVERRGGMLIHGAIIARELGIPCVNGVADAADLIQNGETVTVDGYLGIVTVGMPELDLEKQENSHRD